MHKNKALTQALIRADTPALPLLYLEWLDASTITHGGWLSREEVMDAVAPGRFVNQTVGWLLSETKEHVVIAAQVAVHESSPSFDLCMYIPKSLIRKRKVIQL